MLGDARDDLLHEAVDLGALVAELDDLLDRLLDFLVLLFGVLLHLLAAGYVAAEHRIDDLFLDRRVHLELGADLLDHRRVGGLLVLLEETLHLAVVLHQQLGRRRHPFFLLCRTTCR